MTGVTVADIVAAISERFPPQRAEGWDRVGLLAGDPAQAVLGVTLALDPTLSALASTAEAGHNVLLTHHPAFLETPRSLVAGSGPGGLVFSAIDAGVALINAHTNLDRDPAAQRLLPDALGLHPIRPLETSPMPMAMVTVYAPAEASGAVTQAMAAAGAGRIGDYEACSFSATGTGSFTPSPSSDPFIGKPAEPSTAREERVEMVCPPGRANGVVSAARQAHPYEEPLVTVTEIRMARNAASLGLVSSLPAPTTLDALAALAEDVFGTPARVWGDPQRTIETVATATGSAGSMVPDAVAAGVDALVAGEVRYHDALNAVESGLAVVELGHDVSEWPLVALLEQTVKAVPGMTADMVRVLPAEAAWWISKPSRGDR